MKTFTEIRNDLFTRLQSENGKYTFNGKRYALIQQAYPDGTEDNAYYTACAIREGDPVDEDGGVPCYRITWPIIDPDTEDGCDACDWDEPDDIAEIGGYFVDEERVY